MTREQRPFARSSSAPSKSVSSSQRAQGAWKVRNSSRTRTASDLKKPNASELHGPMNRVPLDLRRQIVEAYERKEGTYFELARRFGVGEATVYRLLRLKRERGNVSPGTPSGIAEEELPQLVLLVGEFPHATLEQLKTLWISRNRRELSRSSIVRALRRAGITRKRAAPRRAKTKPAAATKSRQTA